MVKKVVVKETVTEHIEETSDKEKPHHSNHPTQTKRRYVKKTTTSNASSPKTEKKRKMSAREREEMLIENFVGLQHAMTNLSIKFGALSENISGLLQVFEEAARNFASGGRSDDKDMLKKINALLDQNKTIARGLVLMESKLRSRAGEASDESQVQQPQMNSNMIPSPFDTERPKPRPLPSI